jgi:hypothetical protein
MVIPYKITASTPHTPNIIGDTNFQQFCSGVNTSIAWVEVTGAIGQAIENHIIAFIGLPLYTDLVNKYIAGSPALTTEQAQTLEYLQQAAAWYTIYDILPHKLAILASSGVVQNTPEGGSATTSQWGYHEKRLNALDMGDKALDRLLTYLSKQTLAYFDLYKNDAAAKYKRSVFIKTTADLDDYMNIKDSHRTFVSIAPFLKQADADVKKVLCTTLYDAVQVASPTVANAKLIPYIQKLVAYKGAERALPHHRVVVDGDGFRFVSQTDGTTDRRNSTNTVHEQAVGALLNTYQKLADEAVNELVAFLEANIADYPDYANSTCRTVTVGRETTMYASDDLNGAVGFL